MPSRRTNPGRRDAGGLGVGVVMVGRTAVSVVMPSSLAPGGARTHPAGWPKGSRACPTIANVSSRDEMLAAPADEVQFPGPMGGGP